MCQHLNRLNAEEALEWDEVYKRFCETGEWEVKGDFIMTNREIKYKIRKIRDSLNPKNTKSFGYLQKEITMLDELLEYFRDSKKMKVYLVEVVLRNRIEPIAIRTKWYEANDLIGDRVGLIIEMVIDEVYLEGIGICEHWHFDPNELDSSGERLDEFHCKEVDNEIDKI